MSQLKDVAIRSVTCSWVDFRYADILCEFICRKIDSSRIVVRKDSYVLQLARVLKYLFAQSGNSKSGIRQEMHLSLPYHVRDVAQMPSKVESISNIKINLVDLFKIVGLYFLLILFVDRKLKGYRAYVIGVITVAMTYYKAVKRSGADTVHFHGYAFVPDAAVLVHILANDTAIESHYHEYVSFIEDSLHIETNFLHSTNEISSQYAQKFGGQFHANAYAYEVSLADLTLAFNNKPKPNRRIGVYSSGFYCRADHCLYEDEVINEGVIRESKMLAHLYKYAVKRPDIEFVIFPHYSRGVETHEKAVVHYSEILKLNNVSLAGPGVESKVEHANIGLGLTTISNVFWDRLFKGYKTILINPFMTERFIENTSLVNVSVFTDKDSFDEQVDRFLEMNGDDYIKLLAQTSCGDTVHLERPQQSA